MIEHTLCNNFISCWTLFSTCLSLSLPFSFLLLLHLTPRVKHTTYVLRDARERIQSAKVIDQFPKTKCKSSVKHTRTHTHTQHTHNTYTEKGHLFIPYYALFKTLAADWLGWGRGRKREGEKKMPHFHSLACCGDCHKKWARRLSLQGQSGKKQEKAKEWEREWERKRAVLGRDRASLQSISEVDSYANINQK